MLNLFEKKKNIFNNTYPSYKHTQKEDKSRIESYEIISRKVIYYPPSSKEWFGNIYSFNNLYLKTLISYNAIVNKLFISYSNMLRRKKKWSLKFRRPNKKRYTANRIYVSRPELKHTNDKLLIILYTYNKPKLSLEQSLMDIMLFKREYGIQFKNKTNFIVRYKNKTIKIFKKNVEYIFKNDPVKRLVIIINKIISLKKYKFGFKLWGRIFFYFKRSALKKLEVNINKKLLKDLNKFFFYKKSIHFNNSKFNNSVLNKRDLGLISLIQKIFKKQVEVKIVELKAIHLNSDVFSSIVALKLRNRKNKAIRILRKATQLVETPDLHTLINLDRYSESMNKNNVLKTINQQVVSGVRFEASGRLTRRLTAMRAVYKYRYMGSLKNIPSAFNGLPSRLLRGYIKSNLQYTNINSKTPNGTFGLKGWVSSY